MLILDKIKKRFTPIHEMCSHCSMEVKLKNRFETQTCPNCGEDIMPCSICEHIDDTHHYLYDSCTTCPLKK